MPASPRLPRPDLAEPHPFRDVAGGETDASQTLCRILSKFSKILWVRAGSFIVAHFEDDAEASDAKVTGEPRASCTRTRSKS